MKVLVYGAGAIGSYLGGILTLANIDVEILARGEQLQALTTHGLCMDGVDGVSGNPIMVKAVSENTVKGPYDVIFVCLKSHQVAGAAHRIRDLVSPDGMLIMLQNGLPWWYFYGTQFPSNLGRLATLDADGVLERSFTPDMLIGAVTYRSAEILSPGFVRLSPTATSRLIIGELDGSRSARLGRVADLFSDTDLPIEISENIRAAKWKKLLSNLAFGSIAALTQSNASQIARYSPSANTVMALIEEAISVANAVGVKIDANPPALIEAAIPRAAHPPSLLQDVRLGRALELDAVVMSVLELAKKLNIRTPTLEVVASCVGLLNQRVIENGWAVRPSSLRR